MILLTWNAFMMITFTTYGKAMNYWQNKLLTSLSFETHGGLFETFI